MRNELTVDELEGIWIDILLPKTKPILIGCIYKPPDQKNFNDLLNCTLSSCVTQETYILGDSNYDLKVSPSTDHKVKKYLHTLSSNGFEQIIKDISRFGRNSTGERTETFIDHILCNDTSKLCQSGVILFGLSDHYLIICYRKGFKYTFSTHNTVDIRSMNDYNVEKFCNLLDDCDWSPVLGTDCVNTAWSGLFRSILIGIIDRVAPRKTVKQRTEPWMSSSIIDKIRMRDNISHLIRSGCLIYRFGLSP